jgi:hypothetical protein
LCTEPFIADFDPDGIEEHHRVTDIEGAALPFSHLVQNSIGNSRDESGETSMP